MPVVTEAHVSRVHTSSAARDTAEAIRHRESVQGHRGLED